MKYPTDFWQEMVDRCASARQQLDAMNDLLDGQLEGMKSVPMAYRDDAPEKEVRMSNFLGEHLSHLLRRKNGFDAMYGKWAEFEGYVNQALTDLKKYGS